MNASPSERVVRVDVRPHPYDILIRSGNLQTLGARLAEKIKPGRAAVITDTNVGPLYADVACDSLRQAGFEPALITVPAGEQSKSLQQLARVYDELAAARIARDCPLVALGGGVVGDLTGYAAATWQRGVPFVQVPTSLEADLDSSVGGKTGINHASGKNMIGAFYQPLFVLIDTDTLRTLGRRDFIAGLAESVKHAIIRDAAFFEWHEQNVDAILGQDPATIGELVERNVRIKADVVALDEREVTGVRALLNFGHTVGHAIETAMARRGDPWRHGEAVAAGMVAATEMSIVSGRLDRADGERIINLLKKIGLPVTAPLAEFRSELLTLIQADKKVAAGRIRFVLAEAIGWASLVADIRPEWIDAGLQRACTPATSALT